MYGGAGSDTLDGGAGDDTLAGGSGSDTFVFAPGHGDDSISDFTDGEDLIDLSGFTGISGFDDLTVTATDDGVTIDLTAHGGGKIVLDGFDIANLDATDFLFSPNDVDRGSEDQRITASIDGGTVHGDAGVDVISGHVGADTLYGGSGADFLLGGDGDDTIYGDAGNDLLVGGSGSDVIYGGTGDDYLVGGHSTSNQDTTDDGDDSLYGGSGDDTITGNVGDDTLDGGVGDDSLSGGAGNDTFVFGSGHGDDTITDFTDGEDLIDLSQISGIEGFEDLTISADGDDAIIDLSAHGGGTIRLNDVSVSDLDATDFTFYEAPADTSVEGI